MKTELSIGMYVRTKIGISKIIDDYNSWRNPFTNEYEECFIS